MRQRELRPLPQALERLILDDRLDLALELELQVRLHFGAKRRHAAARDAERLRERFVERRHMRLGDFFGRQREVRDLAGDFLAVIIGWKRQREIARFAGRDARCCGLEIRQHAPFTDSDRKILRLSAWKRDTVDRAGEINDDTVAGLSCALHRHIPGSLLAQHVDLAIDIGASDLGRRATDRNRRHVGD